MIFDGKSAEIITEDEIKKLVTDKVTENRHLDYKERSYNKNAHGTAELLKDVTAFINTDGGYIIIGIKEDGSGRAKSFVKVENAESVRRSLLDRCLTKIEPRPTNLEIAIKVIGGKDVLIIRLPESDRKPHCALPDAEHHYFWRRYEDGNKLMSVAEIHECMEGDRVHREVLHLRRELESIRNGQIIEREMSLEVDDEGLLRFTTIDAFLKNIDGKFISSIAQKPYYRLFACPASLGNIDLKGEATKIKEFVKEPPSIRVNGWNVKPFGDTSITSTGVMGGQSKDRLLKIWWNGYIEFKMPADGEAFRWDGNDTVLYPYAIIEPAVCFSLLANEICQVANYKGDIHIGLGLYNIKGKYLLPYGPSTMGYTLAKAELNRQSGPKPFDEETLRTTCTENAATLPNEVAWKLVSHVYYRFGYEDTQIPFFDNQHQFNHGA